MTRAATLAFFIALAVTLVFAWSPHPPVLIAYDKGQHGLAFVVLVVLGRAAFPRLPWQVLVLALAALGALIELVQLVPQLGRTCDIYDWYADLFAILIGVAAHAAVVAFWSSMVDQAADR